jgi:hypothetical protein
MVADDRRDHCQASDRRGDGYRRGKDAVSHCECGSEQGLSWYDQGKYQHRQHSQGVDRMNMTHPNLERPSKFLQPRGSRHDRLAVTNDFNVLGEFAVVVGIPARVVSGKDLLIQGERTAFSFTRPEAQGEPNL